MEKLGVYAERPVTDLKPHPPDGIPAIADRQSWPPDRKAVVLTPEEERVCDMATE